MIVGKAGIETVDSRQVSHLEMIDDLRDSALYFQETNILQDIFNIMASIMDNVY